MTAGPDERRVGRRTKPSCLFTLAFALIRRAISLTNFLDDDLNGILNQSTHTSRLKPLVKSAVFMPAHSSNGSS